MYNRSLLLAASVFALVSAPVIARQVAAPAPPVAPADNQAALPQVTIAPPPGWVTPITATAPLAKGGVDLRLLDSQIRTDTAGVHQFQHTVIRFNSPASLQLATNLTVQWQPSRGGVTIHVARIIRDGKPIDLLASGKFTTLRQEAQLQMFQLDGTLTAYMPVSDLRVGDELEFSFTTDSQNAALAGHREFEYFAFPGTHYGQFYLAESHPKASTVKARFGSVLPAPKRTEAAGMVTTVSTALDWNAPKLQADTLLREIDNYTVQVTDFASWAEVAATMGQHFVRSSTLAPDSKVTAEVTRIAALSPDPMVRANAALRLVQRDVRYFAELEGLGGYVPISADTVWDRKIGDCKGKTVLLLALLHGLGIEAEPLLVSTKRGEGTDKILPEPGRFDHVIVHARIAGKDYWLDGTRMDSARIEDLESPPFLWGLPLGTASTGLLAIPSDEYRHPQSEWTLEFDASAGLDAPAKASGHAVLRGDDGQLFSQALQVLDPEKLDEFLRAMWNARRSDLTIDRVTQEVDADTGEIRIGFTGTAKMDWHRTGKDATFRYTVDNAQLGTDIVSDHDKPPAADAVVVAARRYARTTTVLLLPDGGHGFTLDGDEFDETIGGVHYTRTAKLTGNRFEMTTTERSPRTEMTAAQGLDADKQTDTLFARKLYIRLPAAIVAKDAPGNADAANKQIEALIDQGQFAPAREQLDLRLSATPRDPQLLALRGAVDFAEGKLSEAKRDLDGALALNPRLPLALSIKARLLFEQGQYDDALVVADRAILITPEDENLYPLRSLIREASGDLEGALADRQILVNLHPDMVWPRWGQVRLLQLLGRPAEALASARDLRKLTKDNEDAVWLLCDLLVKQGAMAEARRETLALDGKTPNIEAAMIRLEYGLSGAPDQQLGDMLTVIKLDPSRQLPEPALIAIGHDPKRLAKLLAAYDSAMAKPGAATARIAIQRGLAVRASGDGVPLNAALGVAEQGAPNDPQMRNEACWERAIWRIDLPAARTSCEAALRPGRVGMYVDSLGMVELQQGNYPAAITLYTEALRSLPESPATLFGRGIARLRTGDAAGGQADLARARRFDPQIDERFVRYGLRP